MVPISLLTRSPRPTEGPRGRSRDREEGKENDGDLDRQDPDRQDLSILKR